MSRHQSLVEYFGEMYKWNVDDMINALEYSDIPKDEIIEGNPVFTFSDESYIMFHNNKDYTISYAN